jgi:hypothetical protein
VVLRYARLQIATRKAAAKPLRWHYTHHFNKLAGLRGHARPPATATLYCAQPYQTRSDPPLPHSITLFHALLSLIRLIDALRNAFTYHATRNANKHGPVRTTPPFSLSHRVVPCGSSKKLAPAVWHLSLSLLGKIRQDRESRYVRVFISFARTVLTADPRAQAKVRVRCCRCP